MHINGGCHCGYITYEAEADPASARICHCTDCQIFSGSAFRTVVPTKGSHFKLLTGKPKTYVKTADSGNQRAQVFCPECGTHIYASSVDDQQVIGIRAGTIRQRAQFKPQSQIWCDSAMPWVMDPNSLSKVPRQG